MPHFPLVSGRSGIPRCTAVAAPAAASPDNQRLTHPAVEDRTVVPERRGETPTGKPISHPEHCGKPLGTNVRGSLHDPVLKEG
ncbi:hypothetical protein G3I31_31025 [Streptomyces sp. SID9913]|uniref:hypothetical protein n=1 Tax=Streptomyces sp. NPDC059515 TaxID=3346854 RepID=UPI00144E318D|nr:hypothetical protein [Streptomyces sp. SID9913]HLU71217.1 hypothetical protein [Nonomuraea sp.]